MKTPIRILIVDDHPLLREGLKTIIGNDERFEVVGEAGNGQDGEALARAHEPEIMLVDISLPGKTGIELVRALKPVLTSTRFLIVSMHAEADYIVEAFRAGAMGYMIKDSASARLLQALETVAAGEMFLDTALSREVMHRLMRSDDQPLCESEPYDSLTPREQEIMRLLAEGMNTREVGKTLFISPKTVENHRANLMRKLGLKSPVELVRYAARLGLIDLDSWAG